MNKFAVILVRGLCNLTHDKRIALKLLNLEKKNSCSVIADTPSNRGLLTKVKDYVTFGEIDDVTLKMMLEKRAEKNPEDPKKTKSFFRLNSPRKGFERKGIKTPYSRGGVLGYRGDSINELLKRMI